MSAEMKDPFEQILKNHLSASPARPAAEPCPDENWMAAYLEGSQSQHFKKTFEQHLLQCNRCQSEMALLLKLGVNEFQSMPADPSPGSNLLEALLAWTRVSALRPVFAIFLVSVVTGVIGYRILRDDRILRESSTDMTESASRTSSAWPKADQPSASAPVNDQKSQEQQPSLKSKPSMVPRRAVPDRLEAASESVDQPRDLRDRETLNKRGSAMKGGYAVEPPSFVPEESNKDASDRLGRRGGDVASQRLQAPLEKESRPASVAGRENSQLGAVADEAPAKPKNQVMPAAPLPGTHSVVGALSERKTEQDKVAHAEEGRVAGAPAQKKQVLTESARQAAAFETNEMTPVSRIEAGGKRFDLSDGIWRDSSILPEDNKPIPVGMSSPDFEKYRKDLAPYHLVLSRPEDVLIKLQSRVYRIQKTPK